MMDSVDAPSHTGSAESCGGTVRFKKLLWASGLSTATCEEPAVGSHHQRSFAQCRGAAGMFVERTNVWPTGAVHLHRCRLRKSVARIVQGVLAGLCSNLHIGF